jgi:arylsulfatase
MHIDGAVVAHEHVDHTVPFKFSPEDAAVGHDTGTPLMDAYRPPFTFDGTLRSLTIDLGPIQTQKPIERH